jgi:hypothetical protein
MPSHVFKIENGTFGLTLVAPVPPADVCAATSVGYTAFTCQITSGALEASPNVSDETIPATWCDPEQTIPSVGATSYELVISYLQDPDVVDGLSQFLFENDTQLAYFFMGLDGDDPPKATGQLRLVSGAIGGEGRVALTAEATLPVEGKPSVCFGNVTTSVPVAAAAAMTAGAQMSTPATATAKTPAAATAST